MSVMRNVAALLAGALFAVVLLAAGVSRAQQKAAKGVITLQEIQIVGRIQKPIAAVDVNRIQPKLMLHELRQPFLDRIEKAVYDDPAF
jgi:hypothetical protein